MALFAFEVPVQTSFALFQYAYFCGTAKAHGRWRAVTPAPLHDGVISFFSIFVSILSNTPKDRFKRLFPYKSPTKLLFFIVSYKTARFNQNSLHIFNKKGLDTNGKMLQNKTEAECLIYLKPFSEKKGR